MATRTWSAAAAGNWNVDANWSGGAVPTVDDDVVFDATSTYGCTVDISPSINSFVATAAYTGNITFSGRTITVALGFSDDGSGTRNYGNGLTANGSSSTVHFGATLGAVEASVFVLRLNGTTGMIFDDDKGILINSIITAANSVVTTSGAANTTVFPNYGSTPLTIGAGATFTMNKTLILSPASTANVFLIGSGATFNGTAQLTLQPGDVGTFTLPVCTYTGSGNFFISSGAAVTLNLGGNFIWPGIGILRCGAAALFTFNTNNYNLTFNEIRVGSNASGGTFTFNAGSSIMSFTKFNGLYVTGTTNINLQTSSMSVSGDVTFGANHTVTGTSAITITNTSTITSNGKSVYNFVINAAGRTITLADTLTIATGGSITVTAFTAFAGSQHIVFAGSGSISIATAVSNRLRTAVAGSTIAWNTGANTWTIPAYTANDWGGTSGSYVLWRSSTPGSQYKISAPAGVAIGYMDIQDCNNTGTMVDAKTTANTDSGNNLGFDFAVVIDTVSPGSGVTGTTVTISGHSFLSPQGSGKVEFIIGGLPVAAASYVSWTDTEIVVTSPVGSGAADVKVTSSDGDTATAAAAFTMQVPVVGENRMNIGLFLGL